MTSSEVAIHFIIDIIVGNMLQDYLYRLNRYRYLLEHLGCHPRHWLLVDGVEDEIDFCNETENAKIEEIYQYLNNETKDITKFMADFSSARGSCDRMSVITLTEDQIEETGGENLTITVRYVAQSYQEVFIYSIFLKQCIHKNILF